MKANEIRTLVREVISEVKKGKNKMVKSAVVNRLKMIDEAGDKAALQAKISKIDEDIKAAHEIKNAIPVDIKHFADPEIVGDLMNDIENSIKELEAKKKELEEQMKGMDKPVKGTKNEKKVDEARFSKGTDIGKPGKGFSKIAKSAAKQYGSKEAGQKVAGSVLKKVIAKNK